MRVSMGAICFPRSESKLPKPFIQTEAQANGDSDPVYAITGTDEFIIYGGAQNQRTINELAIDKLAQVVRMDLATNTIRWAKVMEQKGEIVVTGLVLDPLGKRVAAYLHGPGENDDIRKGHREGWLVVLSTADGGPTTPLKGNKHATEKATMFYKIYL